MAYDIKKQPVLKALLRESGPIAPQGPVNVLNKRIYKDFNFYVISINKTFLKIKKRSHFYDFLGI